MVFQEQPESSVGASPPLPNQPALFGQDVNTVLQSPVKDEPKDGTVSPQKNGERPGGLSSPQFDSGDAGNQNPAKAVLIEPFWKNFVEAEGDVEMPLHLKKSKNHHTHDSDESLISLGVESGFLSDEGNHGEVLNAAQVEEKVGGSTTVACVASLSSREPSAPLFPGPQILQTGRSSSELAHSSLSLVNGVPESSLLKADILKMENEVKSCIVCGRRGLTAHMSKNRCISV